MDRALTPAEADGTAGYRIIGLGGEFMVTEPGGRAAAREAGLDPALEVCGRIEPGWLFTVHFVPEPEAEL